MNGLASTGSDNGSFLLDLNLGRPFGMNLLSWISDDSNVNKGFPMLSETETMPYVLSFDVSGGSPLAAFTLFTEDSISAAPVTVKSGYVFGGWYTDPTDGSLIEFPFTPSAHTTLYARWTPERTEETAEETTAAAESESRPAETSTSIPEADLTGTTVTKTGDSAPIVPIVILFCVAAAAVGFSVTKFRTYSRK